MAFSDASASVGQWYRALRTSVDASGKPEAWQAMLTDLGVALQRARLHGFSEQELEEARTAFLAEAEQAVQREATRPAPAVLRHINAKVARREPIASAAQNLALLKQLLPGITADGGVRSVRRELRSHQRRVRRRAALWRRGAHRGGAGRGRAAPPSPCSQPSRRRSRGPRRCWPRLPSAGMVVDSEEHTASGVTSARLDNGVRVHHRFMDQRKNEATVAITLAGGVIQEDGSTRGITEAAAQAWERPATSTLSSPQIESLMTGKKVRVPSERRRRHR